MALFLYSFRTIFILMMVMFTAFSFLLALSRSVLACTDGEYAPYPNDCNKYQICNHGKFEAMNCPSGLFWNNAGKYCDWPASSGCTPSGQSTTSPPGPTIPSTTQPSVTTTTQPFPPVPTSGKKLICYFTDWSWYRQGLGKYSPENIDPTLCTHIVYGFILLDPNTYQVKIADSWADIDNKFYEKVTSLKTKGVKVTVAIGGWTDSEGGKYSQLVNDPAKRSNFVRNVVQFINQYNFDGLDLDWEYPTCWQGDCNAGPPSDRDGFASLVTELRQALPTGSILSAAVSASKPIIPTAYNVPLLSATLDWIGVMNYDYNGPWNSYTGINAPLYYKDGDKVDYFNIDSSMKTWLSLGADPAKIVMGIPTYGKSFQLSNPANHGLQAPSSGPGNAGQYTNAAGTLAYYEICSSISSGWTVVQDNEGKIGPYAYKGNQWVSYDDPSMVRRKMDYVKQKGLGGRFVSLRGRAKVKINSIGAMVWSLDFDDFNNICGQGKYPIIRAIKEALNS